MTTDLKRKLKFWTAGVLFVALMLGLLVLKSCQSGTLNAYIGRAARLKVPADCHQVLGLTYGQDGRKMLTYRTIEGEIVMKEFSDHGLLEAKYILSGAKFDENGIRIKE